MVSKQSWAQDTNILKHLALSLVRSKLTYGQEVFFSAPKYLLKKMQSLDCKAFRLALGVPSHTSSIGTYKLLGILSLEEQRQLAVAKYVLRSFAIDNNLENEIYLKSDVHFPNRAKTISSLTTINTYTHKLFQESKLNPAGIAKSIYHSPSCPTWELQRANFDINHSSMKKSENENILSTYVKEHLSNKYSSHLKVFTDGSLLSNNEAGAAFIVPSLKIEKLYYIGKNHSIFTAELTAITMALHYLLDFPKTIVQVVVCVDSKSVLHALKNSGPRVRQDLIF